MFEAIQQQYSQHPEQGPVQLIATGALSNVAMLLLLYPEVKPLIEITIMGGAMGVSSCLECWSCMLVHQQVLDKAWVLFRTHTCVAAAAFARLVCWTAVEDKRKHEGVPQLWKGACGVLRR
jgi:hypothetical protein